jgi:bacteriocin-like protein
MERIMGKTNETHRELTINELDAVSGGSIVAHDLGPDNLQKKNVTNAPPWGPAMDAWNKLLHRYGYA